MEENKKTVRRGRPPKNTVANNDTKLALIRSGIESMTTHGYLSSNIESILNKVGVPKGSFYYYFKSKEDFGRTILDNYAQFFAYKLDKCLKNNDIDSPLARLTRFYDDAKIGMVRYEFNRGCLVGELMQEESLLPQGYSDILNDILTDWQNRVEACLIQAQKSGEIKAELNCKELAQFFWIGWEGAVMRCKMLKNSTPIDLFFNLFLSLIQVK